MEHAPHAIEIVPSGPVRARLEAPPSKSVTNRALVVAALAEGESVLRSPLESDDTDRMAEVLGALGARIERAPGEWRVRGTAGQLRTTSAPLDAGLSGTTLRFAGAVAALAPGEVHITGASPLLRRPIGPLAEALRALGAGASARGDLPPLVLAGGGIEGGEVVVDAARSSQFATAIMLVAPHARRDVTIEVRNLGAGGFLEITARLMQDWGVEVEQQGPARWRVPAGQRYRARDYTVPYDASAAAHLFALAMTTGGEVTVTNAVDTPQPDAGITALFERMGATIERGEGVTVRGRGRPSAVEVDLGAMPDQVTTVAAVAALAADDSRITGVAIVREHETDRIAATASELRMLGAVVEEEAGGMVVRGGAALHGGRVATHDDHRIAMSFAALGAKISGVVILDPGCVAKTYPAFWDDLRRAGVGRRAEEDSGA